MGALSQYGVRHWGEPGGMGVIFQFAMSKMMLLEVTGLGPMIKTD